MQPGMPHTGERARQKGLKVWRLPVGQEDDGSSSPGEGRADTLTENEDQAFPVAANFFSPILFTFSAPRV